MTFDTSSTRIVPAITSSTDVGSDSSTTTDTFAILTTLSSDNSINAYGVLVAWPTSTSPMPTATCTPAPSPGLGAGSKAAIALGVLDGALLSLGLTYLAWRQRRASSSGEHSQTALEDVAPGTFQGTGSGTQLERKVEAGLGGNTSTRQEMLAGDNTVLGISSHMNQAVDTQAIAWEPGVWRRAWKSSFSIIAFVVCVVALVAVLVDSNGKAVDSWPRSSMPISVSVLLSLIVGIANVCLTIALNQSYTVSWWLKALQGAELRRLQFDLGIQHDVSALLGRGRTVNKFALAAIISLIVSIIDGPLIQRSSTTILRTFGPDETIVTVRVTNASLPADFSGYAGGGIGPDLLMPLFANVSRAYSDRDAIALQIEGCTTNTTCIFSLPATGFDVGCTESTVEYDFGAFTAAGENTITTFNVSLAFGGPEESRLLQHN
ncbi:hypothetical protein BDW66DRAFT_154751 [Aspergillus desertorum]